MTLTGGKRKVNKSLKAWVAFVKKVQKEEKLSYKDAIHRAKQRKDKGEKWMTGGETPSMERETTPSASDEENEDLSDMPESTPVTPDSEVDGNNEVGGFIMGGKRRRRTMRRSRGRGRGRSRTARRARGRASRRH